MNLNLNFTLSSNKPNNRNSSILLCASSCYDSLCLLCYRMLCYSELHSFVLCWG